MEINYLNLDIDQAVKDEMLWLLKSLDNNKDDLENIWQLLDRVWNKLGCNNKKLNWSNIDKFYSHPVWLLNGLFIERNSHHRKPFCTSRHRAIATGQHN